MLTSLLGVIIVVLVLGFIAWLVSKAPSIDPTIKQIAVFLIIAIAAIIVIYFLLGLVGHQGINPRLTI